MLPPPSRSLPHPPTYDQQVRALLPPPQPLLEGSSPPITNTPSPGHSCGHALNCATRVNATRAMVPAYLQVGLHPSASSAFLKNLKHDRHHTQHGSMMPLSTILASTPCAADTVACVCAHLGGAGWRLLPRPCNIAPVLTATQM
jgi:hypothetical protein